MRSAWAYPTHGSAPGPSAGRAGGGGLEIVCGRALGAVRRSPKVLDAGIDDDYDLFCARAQKVAESYGDCVTAFLVAHRQEINFVPHSRSATYCSFGDSRVADPVRWDDAEPLALKCVAQLCGVGRRVLVVSE